MYRLDSLVRTWNEVPVNSGHLLYQTVYLVIGLKFVNVEEPTSHYAKEGSMNNQMFHKKSNLKNCPISLPGHEQKDTQSLGHTMMVPGGGAKGQLGSQSRLLTC